MRMISRPAASLPSDQSPGSGRDKEITSYNYNSEDGMKQKATLEHLSGILVDTTGGLGTAAGNSQEVPWMVGWQMSERNIVWNDELKISLIKERLLRAPPKLVARLAANTGSVAQRIVRLKSMFPEANVSNMVSNRLTLLLEDDLDAVQIASTHLRELLPAINVDKFAETFPVVLDYESFDMAVQDAKRILPDMDLPDTLRRNPQLILSLVKGKALIPYDDFKNPWS
eukprot:gene4057-14143_t